jgi:hypothetical protein
MKTGMPFLFTDAGKLSGEGFVLRVRTRLRTKDELLSFYNEAGGFPGYFGMNWDAFEEVLNDFSWIKEPQIQIVHEDLPLSSEKKALGVYLDILRSASVNNPGRLFVRFPISVREEVIRVLSEK